MNSLSSVCPRGSSRDGEEAKCVFCCEEQRLLDLYQRLVIDEGQNRSLGVGQIGINYRFGISYSISLAVGPVGAVLVGNGHTSTYCSTSANLGTLSWGVLGTTPCSLQLRITEYPDHRWDKLLGTSVPENHWPVRAARASGPSYEILSAPP